MEEENNEIQKKIAFLGPKGTFTHQSALKHFKDNDKYIPVLSIKDVFSYVESDKADYGVVPVENSSEGVVNHTLDMFIDSNITIVSEKEEQISHCLFSQSGKIENVKTICSHPQALAQCRAWIESNTSGLKFKEVSSTAEAASLASMDISLAAIASKTAGKLYGLKTIENNIEDSDHNATRFLVLGKETTLPTENDKTLILFSLKHHVGALYDALEMFKNLNINLTKIESRPNMKKAWEYVFFLEFVGHQKEKGVKKALQELKTKCLFVKILGSYSSPVVTSSSPAT